MIEVARCSNEAEKQLSVDVYNAVWPHDAVTLAEVRSFEESLSDHVDLLARVEGEIGGSGFAAIQPERPEVVLVLVTVLAELRRRGAGSALYAAVSDWARERGFDTLEAVLSDDDPESLAFAERRGFAEDRREKGVTLDLTAIEPPGVDPPEGIEIVSWAERPDLVQGMYEVELEASPDIPGSEEEVVQPFDEWLAHHLGGPGDRPDATFVAVAGEDVVGYAKFSLSGANTRVAYHDLTGVKRAWRGRGIARALKTTQVAWAKANGYEELRTRNDERNAPIRHLNRELGYRPAIGRIYLRGPLSHTA